MEDLNEGEKKRKAEEKISVSLKKILSSFLMKWQKRKWFWL